MSKIIKGQLDRVRNSIRVFQEEEARLSRELGEEPQFAEGSDLLKKKQQEDSDAELFDRLAPAELLDLFYNDNDQWTRIMKVKEDQGTRRLLGW